MKLSFITIIFNHKLELKLLQLQAYSFKFVSKDLIDKIYIILNDDNINNLKNNIKAWYDKSIQHKIEFVHKDELFENKDNKNTSWFSQQILKLLIHNKVNSEYYCVLDSKNHFIRKISENDFFNDNKPVLFTNNPGTMIEYFNKTCDYFKIDKHFKFKLLTTTPFILSKSIINEMILYLEKKENMKFEELFLKNKNIFTEFYLFQVYLIFSNKINNYNILNKKNYDSFMNYQIIDWNSWENKKKNLLNDEIKIFGIHRNSIQYMDEKTKNEIIDLYINNFFIDEKGKIKYLLNDILLG